jgi:hypothetical protein
MAMNNDNNYYKGGRRSNFIDEIIAAYLDGKLRVQDVAAAFATNLEVEGVQEVLNRLIDDGRLTRSEADEMIRELYSARSAENKVAATTATAAGGTAAVWMVSGAGLSGLSASGITSGLAALGGIIGGGMAAGLVVTAGGAFIAGAGVFVATKRLVRYSNERSLKKRAENRAQ